MKKPSFSIPSKMEPVGRFPGEFFALGLVIALGTMILAGTPAALSVASVLGLVQVVLLRKQRLAGAQTRKRLEHAEAEAKKWQDRANTFMHELACFKEQVAYQDPETGVGSARQFEVDFIKQVARYRRRSEPFAVALLQVRDPRHGDAAVDPAVVVAAAHRLAETARVEDSLCRVARRGFAVLLAGADSAGAAAYLERARQRFVDAPVVISGTRIDLSVTGGVAQYSEEIQGVQEFLAVAAQDLHTSQRMVAEPHTVELRLAS